MTWHFAMSSCFLLSVQFCVNHISSNFLVSLSKTKGGSHHLMSRRLMLRQKQSETTHPLQNNQKKTVQLSHFLIKARKTSDCVLNL